MSAGIRAQQTLSEEQQRLHVAADWWLRLREPEVPPEAVTEWLRWCDAHPDNKKTFADLQVLWHKAAEAPLRPVSADELARDRDSVVPRPAVYAARKRSGGSRLWAAAASFAALALAALFAVNAWRGNTGSSIENGLEVATAIGFNRQVSLPDGTQVVLGGDSRLRPEFSAGQRIVRMSRGEAYFEVRPDKQRPFVVVTPDMAVTAIGTAFNVRADGGVIRVTVTEGMVAVRAAADSAAQSQRLRAGQQLTVDAHRSRPAVAVDTKLATAWIDGTLKFMDEPLDSVVAAVNRYSRTPIVLQGGTGAQLHYTGTVVTDRIEEWLAALPDSFPVRVIHGPSSIVIQFR